MTLAAIKKDIVGGWKSIAPEIRTSALKNENGSAKPFYLTRDFGYTEEDQFTLTIINSADAYGKIPLAEIFIKGHIAWVGDHPIAPGAQKVNFNADIAYDVTPLIQGFADLLNQVAATDYSRWEVGNRQSVFRKNFAPFGLTEGQDFKEFDLIYLFEGMLFWGARNVDNPKLAARYFLNAIDKVNGLHDTYEKKRLELETEIPTLRELSQKTFEKEGELTGLRVELRRLEGEIAAKIRETQMKAVPVDEEVEQKEEQKNEDTLDHSENLRALRLQSFDRPGSYPAEGMGR